MTRRKNQCHGCGKSFTTTSAHRRHVKDQQCHSNTSQHSTGGLPTSRYCNNHDKDCAANLPAQTHTEFLRDLFENELQDYNENGLPLHEQNTPMETSSMEQPLDSSFLIDPTQHTQTECDIDWIVAYIARFLLLWQSVCNVTDTGLSQLLKFLSTLFKLLGKDSPLCARIAIALPSVLSHLRDRFGKRPKFKVSVVCIQCKTLYDPKDCVKKVGDKEVTRYCRNVAFPRSAKQKKCGQTLMKTIKGVDGKTRLEPHKVYHHQSIKDALQHLVNRPGFEDLCEQWKGREENGDILTDIYDGEIWKDFSGNKYDFLNKERHYGLMLNVDWFQPHDTVQYSVGAIYVVILNLPIEHRFKKENVILLGLIPQFDHEPSTNTFLEPLVEELKLAWDEGFALLSHKSPTERETFHLCLLCAGCDIPATRKVSGFLGHTAHLACNHCFKHFPGGFKERKDYSGFDRDSWEPRSNNSHRQAVDNILKKAENKTNKGKLESQYGARYSTLLELFYFDPVRMSIIDPMHNLFLGTAKTCLKVWKHLDFINTNAYDKIQARMNDFKCPSDIGNIPHKISSGFDHLTADQLKNWTLLFSMCILPAYLPKEHLECWQLFVMACRLLCTKVIDKTTIELADDYLMDFCKTFQTLYGKEFVTMNMHLHLHLRQCIFDFGPIYSFWLFSFERYNGMIGNIHTNHKNIEVQLLKKFITQIQLTDTSDLHIPDEELKSVLENLNNVNKTRGSVLSQTKGLSTLKAVSLCSSSCIIQKEQWDIPANYVYDIKSNILPLSEEDAVYLRSMYRFIYGDKVDSDNNFQMCPSYRSANALYYMGQVLGSETGRSQRSSVISAHWCNEDGDINTVNNAPARAGQVLEYVLHKVIVDNVDKWHMLAKVQWYDDLEHRALREMPDVTPSELWSPLYLVTGPATFIPVQRIKCKAVTIKDKINGRDVLFVSPRHRYLVCE